MSLISTTFATELNNKEMRDAYLSAQTRTYLSYQIRTVRSQRGWSQEDFAEKLNTSQSAVSRMEDRQYGKQNLQTLVQIANTFDCGLLVQFVPYDEFIRKTNDLSRDALEVAQFSEISLLPLSEDIPAPSEFSGVLKFYNRLFFNTYQYGAAVESEARIPAVEQIFAPWLTASNVADREEELEQENARLKAENEQLKEALGLENPGSIQPASFGIYPALSHSGYQT